jgi:hypothetical protein
MDRYTVSRETDPAMIATQDGRPWIVERVSPTYRWYEASFNTRREAEAYAKTLRRERSAS